MASMNGSNSQTGKSLAGVEHLRQSIKDILTTPIGSRVMRRDYGSRLFELIDAPMNRSTLLEMYAATAEALAKWEPRFELLSVQAVTATPGRVELDMVGKYLIDGQTIKLDGIIIE
jgi:uncharacterized protein